MQKIIYFTIFALLVSLTVNKLIILDKEGTKAKFDPEGSEKAVFFNYTLDYQLEEGEYLAFIATPLDFKSDPDIFISYTDEAPGLDMYQNYTNSGRCSLYGADICFVPMEHQKRQWYYIGALCENKCEFLIKPTVVKEEKLKLGDAKEITLEENYYPYLYVVNIPETTKKHIQFILSKQANKFIDFDDKWNQSSTSFMQVNSFDLPSTNWWTFPVYQTQGGEIFQTSENQETFCINCDYRILIYGRKNEKLKLSTHVDNYEGKLAFNKEDINSIYKGETFTYTINTREEGNFLQRDDNNHIAENLLFSITPMEGDPNMFINCDSKPYELADYKWHSSSRFQESIFIETFQLAKLDTKCDTIYLSVFAETATAFSLKATTLNSNSLFQLHPGQVEIGYLQVYDILNYQFFAPNDGKVQISVNLQALNGNPDLYIKQCKSKDQCTITKSEIENAENLAADPKNFFIFSKQRSSENIVFEHDSDKCQLDLSIGCLYVAAVYANKNQQEQTNIEFQLSMHLEDYQMTLLDNHPLQLRADIYDWQYYKFTLQNDADINSVNFQLTFQYGQAHLMGSRSIKFPNFKTRDNIACFCVNLLNYTRNKDNESLAGTYNIAVYPFAKSQYTIKVFLERKEPDQNYHKIFNGEEQKITIQEHEKSFANFAFEVFNTDYPVDLQITPVKGSEFTIYLINSGTTPFSKIKDQKEVIISTTLNLFIPPALMNSKQFRFVVEYAGEKKPAQFLIKFQQAVHKIFQIYTGNQFLTKVTKNQSVEIQFDVEEYDDQLLVLSSQGLSEANIQLKSYEQQEYAIITNQTTKSSSIKSLIVFGQNFAHCQKYFNNGQRCPIHGEITTKSIEYVDVSLTLLKQNNIDYFTPFALLNNMTINMDLPFESDGDLEFFEYNFFFKPVNPTNCYNIEIMTKNVHFLIKDEFHSIDSTTDNHEEKDFSSYFPKWDNIEGEIKKQIESEKGKNKNNTKLSQYQSKLLSFSKEDLEKKCSDTCLITMSIIFYKTKDSFVGNKQQFTIEVFSDYKTLSSQAPVYGKVAENEVTYYSFYNNECEVKQNLIFTLDTYGNSDVDIYVNNGKAIVDIKEPKDYSSDAVGEIDTIKITEPKCGFYTVMVIGYSKGISKYRLSVTSTLNEYTSIHPLDEGVYQSIFLEKKEIYYFVFEKPQIGPIEVSLELTSIYGVGRIFINRIDYEQDIQSHLPSVKNSFYNSEIYEKLNIQISPAISSNQLYTKNRCKYIIGIKGKHESLGLQIVAKHSHSTVLLKSGQHIRDQLNYYKKNVTYEYHISQCDEDLNLWFNSLQGDYEIQYYFDNTKIVNKKIYGGGEYTYSISLKNYSDQCYNYSNPLHLKIEVSSKITDKYLQNTYELQVYEKDQGEINLVAGQIYSFKLGYQEKKQLVFYSEDLSHKTSVQAPIYNFTILCDKEKYQSPQQFLDDFIMFDFLVEKSNLNTTLSYQTKELSDKTQDEKAILRGGGGYFILQLKGTLLSSKYGIKFIARKQIDFTITQTSYNFITTLKENSQFIKELDMKNENSLPGLAIYDTQSDNYEIFVSTAGVLLIQIQDCVGQFYLRTAKSYDDLVKKRYEKINAKKLSGKTYYKLDVQPGVYYFNIFTNTQQGNIQEVLSFKEYFTYQLETKILSGRYVPELEVFEGNHGKSTAKKLDENHFEIEISNIETNLTQQFKDYPPMIYVMLTKSRQSSFMYKRCQLTYYKVGQFDNTNQFKYDSLGYDYQEKFIKQDKIKIKFDATGFIQSIDPKGTGRKRMYAAVVIEFQPQSFAETSAYGDTFQVEYNSVVLPKRIEENSSIAMKIILIIAIILLVLVLLYLYRRNQKRTETYQKEEFYDVKDGKEAYQMNSFTVEQKQEQ